MTEEITRFLTALGSTLLWSIVSILIVLVLFEVLERRYHMMKEIFHENSTAAAVLAGSFVLGIFYTVARIVVG